MRALGSKEFQISHFCLTIGAANKLKGSQVGVAPQNKWKWKSQGEESSGGGHSAAGDNLKSSSQVPRGVLSVKKEKRK